MLAHKPVLSVLKRHHGFFDSSCHASEPNLLKKSDHALTFDISNGVVVVVVLLQSGNNHVVLCFCSGCGCCCSVCN